MSRPSAFLKSRPINLKQGKYLAFFVGTQAACLHVLMEKPFKRRDLLGIRDLTAAEIVGILDTAENFSEISTREVKKVPALRGKTVINLFFEASTRTRTSFE